MKATGPFGGPVDIAIDFHYGGRYDKGDGPGPVRKKSKNIADRSGGYATAQCVVNGERPVPGVVPVRKPRSTPDFVPELIHVCNRVGAGIDFVRTGRGFLDAGAIRCLSENGIRFPIPRGDTDTVVAAPGLCSGRAGHRVSEPGIDGAGEDARPRTGRR